MKIRNRISDIKDLQTRVLQEYFRLQLSLNYVGNTWKEEFNKEIERGKNNEKYASQYVGCHEILLQKGLDKFSVKDMDTTIITAVLKWGVFSNFINGNMRRHLFNLQSDRNYESHLNGNETEHELMGWAKAALYNVKEFVKAVRKAPNVSLENFRKYYMEFDEEIENISECIISDYKESILEEAIDEEMNNNIDDILRDEDPHKRYNQIYGNYLRFSNMERTNKFLKKAAEEAIIWSMPELAERHCSGYGSIRKDYNLAAYYFEEAFDILTPQQKLMLASIYLNELTEEQKIDRGIEIKERIEKDMQKKRKQGIGKLNDIVEYEQDGMIFYACGRKQK